MARYRIIIDIDTNNDRLTFNEAAKLLANKAMQMNGFDVVYLATESVVDKQREIFREKEDD